MSRAAETARGGANFASAVGATGRARYHPSTFRAALSTLLRIAGADQLLRSRARHSPNLQRVSAYLLTLYRTKHVRLFIFRFAIASWSNLCLTMTAVLTLKDHKIP